MGTTLSKNKRNRILSWIVNLAGVLAFGLILYLGGIEPWKQIARADWRHVLAAFALTLAWDLVATYRWALIADRLAGRTICAFRYYFTYQMLGMLVGQVMPITVGMLGGRPVALSLSQDVSLKRSALSVFVDKFFDLLLALLLVLPVALYLVGWIERPVAFVLMGGVVVVSVLLIGWQYEQMLRLAGRVGSRLANPLAHLPVIGYRLARRLPQQLERLSSETLVQNRVAVQAFLLTLLLYALLSARLFFISQALGLEIPWYLLAMGVAVTQLALVFSITPGSLGFLEGGWAAVLGLGGITLEQFTSFVIGRRAFVLVFTVIGTLLAFVWIRESPAHLFRAVLTPPRQGEDGQSADPPSDPAVEQAV